jgi:hypothetical protein
MVKESSVNGISLLERWYSARCNGTWEHGYGVKIDTIDNPGWTVRIGLHGTAKQNSKLERVKLDRTEDNWIHYRTEKSEFHIRCGARNLSEAIQLFVDGFDSNSK